MPAIAPVAAACVVVDFQAVRAARASARTHPQGTSVAARIFMACLALICLAFASRALSATVNGSIAAVQPHHLRAYCANVGWSLPLSYRNCFLVPTN